MSELLSQCDRACGRKPGVRSGPASDRHRIGLAGLRLRLQACRYRVSGRCPIHRARVWESCLRYESAACEAACDAVSPTGCRISAVVPAAGKVKRSCGFRRYPSLPRRTVGATVIHERIGGVIGSRRSVGTQQPGSSAGQSMASCRHRRKRRRRRISRCTGGERLEPVEPTAAEVRRSAARAARRRPIHNHGIRRKPRRGRKCSSTEHGRRNIRQPMKKAARRRPFDPTISLPKQADDQKLWRTPTARAVELRSATVPKLLPLVVPPGIVSADRPRFCRRPTSAYTAVRFDRL